MRAATQEDVSRILTEYPLELEKELMAAGPVQLSQPLEGDPRVKVSVMPGKADFVPRVIPFRLNHDKVKLKLEVSEDYQDYRPLQG